MFWVLYHSSGKDLVSGILPLIAKDALTRQYPKFGNDTIALPPILRRFSKTSTGARVACKVWLRITKSKAFVGSMPEVHHNEILSWDADVEGSKSNYVLILLRDNSENSQIAKRFDLTQKLLGEKVEIFNIEPKSQSTTLFKLMELVLLGDLFSISLADELNMIPEDIEGIENLKKLLED